MYGGLGGGSVSAAATGAVSTVGGVVALPNTGGSPLLIGLSIATIAMGAAILVSFTATRVASRLYR